MILLSLLAAAGAVGWHAVVVNPIKWNHLGYESSGPKTALYRQGTDAVSGFEVIDSSGAVALEGNPSEPAAVPGWGTAPWIVLDFSGLRAPGRYRLRLQPSGTATDLFSVGSSGLMATAGREVLGFFHEMRNTDPGDRKMGYFGQPERGTRDVYGGWRDATGDAGKYLSHLSYANFMNPQQIPMVVWSLLRAELLAPTSTGSLKSDFDAEAAWGADYLLRVQDPAGYFYINVFDRWGGDPRKISAWIGDSLSQGTMTSDYQAAWREGGGTSIAALALAARMGIHGDSTSAQYLAGAIRGFDHLSSKPGLWADDGTENLIDHYCALLAAIELHLATGAPGYLEYAGSRVDSVVARQNTSGWFVSDNSARPFHHGVDEGLPMVALATYLRIDSASPRADRVRSCLARSLAWYRTLATEVANPFLYPRMYAPLAPVPVRTSGGNLAPGSKVTVSGTESAAYKAENVVDGSESTRWSGPLKDSAAWVLLDLGHPARLDSVGFVWEAAYAARYDVLVSLDGSTWTTAASGGAIASGRDGVRLSGDSARFVKMQTRKLANSNYPVSMYEFRVFGRIELPPVAQVPSKSRFFLPHRNESRYWWQGENARLGSMAAAFALAGRAVDPAWNLGWDTLSRLAVAPVDWVAGKNTEGINFVYGVQAGDYASYNGGRNLRGGICNGISGDSLDAPLFNNDGGTPNWRWVEQWLPHDSWFLLGAASLAHLQEFPADTHTGVRRREPGPVMKVWANSGRIEADVPGAKALVLREVSGRIMAIEESGKARWSVRSGVWLVEARFSSRPPASRVVAVP